MLIVVQITKYLLQFQLSIKLSQQSMNQPPLLSSDFLDSSPLRPLQQANSLKNSFVLSICNLQSKYRLKYGPQFKEMLDARDQILAHEFDFKIDMMNRAKQMVRGESFLNSELYSELKEKIKDFLAESLSNIISIGFKYLCKQELQEAEAKEFAAKNILLNIHAIYKQTIRSLQNHDQLKGQIDIKNVKNDLIIQIDNMVNNILINLTDNYPQAPPTGGTPRMRQVITEVNRVDDQENDFVFTNNIKIGDYLTLDEKTQINGVEYQPIKFSPKEDYTEFIMRVINSVIEVAQDHKEDARERTIFEKFTQFSQHLFWLAQEKDYQKTMVLSKKKSLIEDRKKQDREIEMSVSKKFGQILTTNKVVEDAYVELGNTWEIDRIGQLWDSAQEDIEAMKKNKKYALGQKIPASVKPFTRQEITSKQFSARHSSILRILTKWAGYLQGIFENAEQFVRRRLYAFKNINNELCILDSQDQDGMSKLIRQLEDEYSQIKHKFGAILTSSYGYIGQLLSKQGRSVVSSVHKYNETRVCSSKINAVLTSLMLNYSNLLIHHLLKAGQGIWTDKNWQSINLVGFRIGDLMRSKLQCSQSAFINILKTMYILDNSPQMSGKFKLVRIKNKLDEPANNIMVNYLFMGKVQCELQLSIQEPKGKQKHYYTYSHFVYELIRGKFGSIAQCAIMISQLDPMVNACKGTYYTEKETTIGLIKHLKQEKKSSKIRGEQQPGNISKRSELAQGVKKTFFQCLCCGRLIINENIVKFHAEQYQKTCFDCIIKTQNPESCFKEPLSSTLYSLRESRIKNYSGFRYLKDYALILSLTNSGQLTFYIVIYIPKDFKTLLVKVDSRILNNIGSSQFDFRQVDYLNISKDIKDSVKNPKDRILSYMVYDVSSLPQQVFYLANLERVVLEKKLPVLIEEYRKFREEKSIIKTIKFKAEIIQVSQQSSKILDKVIRLLILGKPPKNKEDWFRYTKYRHLDVSNIKQIKQIAIHEAELTSVPHLVIGQCHNLKKLSLNQNMIKSVNTHELPTMLTSLSLACNNLQSIDIGPLQHLTYLHLGWNKLKSFQLNHHKSLSTLYLNDNQLSRLDLQDNCSLKILFISDSPQLKNVQYLPASLEWLSADKQAVIKYDFGPLKKLQTLYIFGNQQTSREQIINLREETEFYSQQINEEQESDTQKIQIEQQELIYNENTIQQRKLEESDDPSNMQGSKGSMIQSYKEGEGVQVTYYNPLFNIFNKEQVQQDYNDEQNI